MFLTCICNSKNNLSSYCGLTDSRMSASGTDLPVVLSIRGDPPQKKKRKCSNLLPSYLMQIGKCNFYSRTNIPTYLLPSVTQYFSGHLMLPEASIHGVALGNSTPEEYNEMGCAIVAGIEAGWVINVKSFELFWEFPMWSFFFHFHGFFFQLGESSD